MANHPPGRAEALYAPVGRLDPGSLTAFAGALLQAEAERLGLPADAVVFSQELTVADGGLDVVIRGVHPGGLLPAGTSGWQLRTTKGTAPSALDLPGEMKKPGVAELLGSGGTYVLLWPRELNDQQSQRTLKTLREAAPTGTDPERLVLFDAAALAALAIRHPAVIDAFGLSVFGPSLRTLDEVGRELKARRRRYVADAVRRRLIERLQARLGDPGPHAVRAFVLGLAGTGKSRLVYEALADGPLADRTLWAERWDAVEAFLRWAARERRSGGVLVVDGTGPSADLGLADRLEGVLVDGDGVDAVARWRIIVIESIVDSRRHPDGYRDFVVPPLEAAATTQLVASGGGLDPERAAQVAELAEGFPALAFALARTVRENPGVGLGDLVHLHEPNVLLTRALGDPELHRILGPLALFGSVGVDGDDGAELAAIAGAFDLPLNTMRATLERERRRYVGQAGPFRFITPLALAVWLAIDVLESVSDIDEIVMGLPRGLRRAFHDQLVLFGGPHPELARAMKRMVTERGLLDPATFGEEAADVVRAAATTIPVTVAAELNAMLAACDDKRLRELPRGALLGAIVRLVRNPATTSEGMTALFALARVDACDSPSRSRFHEAFDVAQGATEGMLVRRLAWLRERSDDPLDLAGRELLIAACTALTAVRADAPGGDIATMTIDAFPSERAALLETWRERDTSIDRRTSGVASRQPSEWQLATLRREAGEILLRLENA